MTQVRAATRQFTGTAMGGASSPSSSRHPDMKQDAEQCSADCKDPATWKASSGLPTWTTDEVAHCPQAAAAARHAGWAGDRGQRGPPAAGPSPRSRGRRRGTTTDAQLEWNRRPRRPRRSGAALSAGCPAADPRSREWFPERDRADRDGRRADQRLPNGGHRVIRDNMGMTRAQAGRPCGHDGRNGPRAETVRLRGTSAPGSRGGRSVPARGTR